MSSIKRKLQRQKQAYINLSIKKNKRQKSFVKTLSVLNNNTGEISQLNYDFNKIQQDNYLWIVFNSIYLQNHMDKIGNKVAYFITQTLPTEYHPYITHNKSGKKLKHPIYNKNYSRKNTINQGYKKLNTAFRSFIKDYKNQDDKYDRLYYQKVIEPHKTFVPHLHGLVYVNEEDAEEFEKYFWSKNAQHGLGRAELTRIKDIKRSATYLTKYISKSVKPNEKDTMGNMYDGWKKDNKINVYTYSHIALPRYIFKKVSNVLRLEIQKGQNILEVIENLIDIQIDIHYEDEIIRTKRIKNDNARYIVKVAKDKIIQKDIQYEYDMLLSEGLRIKCLNEIIKEKQIEQSELWDEVKYYLYDIGEIETKDDWYNLTDDEDFQYLYDYMNSNIEEEEIILYRLTDFIIYDKKYDKVIYSKNDYILM